MSARKDQSHNTHRATSARSALRAPQTASGTAASSASVGVGDTSGDAAATENVQVQTAGAFDIRNFIGALLGLFGVILTLMGLFAFTDAAAAKTGGVNANLWAGLGMVVVSLAFLAWTKLDPIRMVVRENEDGAEEPLDIAPQD